MRANVVGVHGPVGETDKIREMQLGANWFYWAGIAAAVNSLLVFFFQLPSMFFGLGITQYVDAHMVVAGSQTQRLSGLALNLAIAGVLAAFGWLTRRGGDAAFVVGMFLYVADAMVSVGYRDIFGFSFHILALFFMFKGLLASRRRYDPSVDHTGA